MTRLDKLVEKVESAFMDNHADETEFYIKKALSGYLAERDAFMIAAGSYVINDDFETQNINNIQYGRAKHFDNEEVES